MFENPILWAAAALATWLLISYPTVLLTRWLHRRLDGSVPWASWEGWLVAVLGAAFCVAFGLRIGALRDVSTYGVILTAIAVWIGVVLVVLDLRLRYVSDTLLYLGIASAVVLRWAIDGSIVPALSGLAIGILFWGLIHVVAAWLYKTKDAFGLGDVILGGFIGAILGPTFGLVAFVIGIFMGGIVAALYLLARRDNRKKPVPYGPFMISGLLAVLLIFTRGILLQ